MGGGTRGDLAGSAGSSSDRGGHDQEDGVEVRI
eukprot:CAMPEP_0194342682 /NCGR_PEP_ID=MMETSP0171-20130528/93726_1 /TAXON_ID=218684 /ORGANISM="Corethron pennatum, Strain L29A3" /LENGTH=32 /DNA_ID= /DNA_START= /DNA_END= /DNA_ORIENTATION=